MFWYVILTGPKDGLNHYVFPLAISLAKGENLVLASSYLGSLYAHLDECVGNVVKPMGRYNVVTHVDTCFL